MCLVVSVPLIVKKVETSCLTKAVCWNECTNDKKAIQFKKTYILNEFFKNICESFLGIPPKNKFGITLEYS
ncbi:hypothetical protein BpHYR1_040263 [Brachionus plicatilis]|uniref:Uncharacterized protein n=1 Tax=Brachionus plicatilis TaxID=10195 RepID=A0A3M7RS62_BRAPC|nr:hypothetical protein BpHYR1_040263 [Brachionus plicatilis]